MCDHHNLVAPPSVILFSGENIRTNYDVSPCQFLCLRCVSV